MDNKQAHGVHHEELSWAHPIPLIRHLHSVIRGSVKILAILMVAVILWGVVDVFYVIYLKLMTPPMFMLDVNDIFQAFGAFMVVLIAIEIFINIRLYLGTNEIPVKLVIATALMAIARKVIVMDLEKISSDYIFAIAAVVLALGVTFWLISREGITGQ
ncbi:phosphate-starvation-inducible PsiE family protein [Litorilituus lipolyticus]|uniref:Phosphate-starvation-inducible E-like protein n=1 Tax=Litorilituus lipolyticus TaxID=2491017 RepID=A0A502LHJ2_9GAMM|nr:phosphate-starvation-inducible PsiE family protein [Litorilituus lipolyticus]TPH19227.1 hypothetical protein EPA86_00415 [Litorilituus lipolyticus]